MIQSRNQFVRYTFLTEACAADLSAVLTYMRENDILPSEIVTDAKVAEGATHVVINSTGGKDWHSHAIAAQFEKCASVRHFGFERLSGASLRAA
ncbi:MAG: hypothetical protein HWE25_04170 [Alphaproteobacteria bacterium]|nr:hypothetical protein [Alphaproteobacteria bacterium]